MAARDKYHGELRQALEKDGWTITHDPYVLEMSETSYEVDLGAEKIIAAEKEGMKIAIELKSFLGESIAYDFHEALANSWNIASELRFKNQIELYTWHWLNLNTND